MGGRRGRLISSEDRVYAVELINEAVDNGARITKACKALDISVSSFERWRKGFTQDLRKGSLKHVARKLTAEEQDKIISICCSIEFKDQNPYIIHATLLDRGIYIASVSSFYRVLRSNGLLKHRGNSRPSRKQSRPPELVATGPNQVWTWDITWMYSSVRGIFYYAYTIIDIWDRSIVKWVIHDRESDNLARELFESAFEENNYPNVFIHSDNGNPMKGLSLLSLFYDLGINNSYSRPRVSDDNPFIEAWFKTLKFHVTYPGKFKSIPSAREWFSDFVNKYNTLHKHSGLNYITPSQMRNGEYQHISNTRNTAMNNAFSKNPLRWSNGVKSLPKDHIVYLNPTADTRIKLSENRRLKTA